MYKIKNFYKQDTEIETFYKSDKIYFDVSELYSTKVKKEIKEIDNVFYVLNSYLNYKGDEFKKELFLRLNTSYNDLIRLAMSKNLIPFPYYLVTNILDLFDPKDIVEFLNSTKVIKIPSVLKEKHDIRRELNKNGSKEQTFIRKDYLNLVALITIIKATSPVLGMFLSLFSDVIPSMQRYYVLLTFFTKHPIYEFEGFVKLRDYIVKILENFKDNREDMTKKIIEKNISIEDFPDYILAQVLFTKYIVIDEISNVETKNAINKLYNVVKSQIDLQATNKIFIKKLSSISSSFESESMSMFETYRVSNNVTIGYMEEFKYIYGNEDLLTKHLGIKNIDLVKRLNYPFDLLKDYLVLEPAVYLVSWVLKNIIDPRSIDYVNIDQIVTSIKVVFVYLLENNYKELAKILTYYKIEDTRFDNLGDMKINISLGYKFNKEQVARLRELYPYEYQEISKKSDVKEKVVNKVQESLEEFIKDVINANKATILDPSIALELELENIMSLDVEKLKEELISLMFKLNGN